MTNGFRVVLLGTAAGFAAVCTLAVPSGPAQAQDEVERGVPVTERQRPELDPLGIRAGAFLIFPQIGVSEAFDDNIFASESDETSDFITAVTPGVTASSQWSRHALNLSASSEIGRYWDNTDEDYEDYFLRGDGRVDITRQSTATGRVGYSELHEDRGEPNEAGGVEPTEFTRADAEAAFRQSFNRLNFTVGGTFNRYDYDDVQNGLGGTINNDDRDRDQMEVSLRGGYEFMPSYEGFVRVTYNERDYDDNVDDAGFNRDSDGYEAVAGVELDLSGVTFGDIYAGYMSQRYDDPALQDVDGPVIGGGITWNATTLTTARLDLSRTVQETTSANASGYIASRVALRVDHELLRNLLIGADGSYTQNDYEGIDREDDNFRAGAYAKYLMNRYVYTTLSYAHRRRDSSISTNDYDQNIVMLKLDFQL